MSSQYLTLPKQLCFISFYTSVTFSGFIFGILKNWLQRLCNLIGKYCLITQSIPFKRQECRCPSVCTVTIQVFGHTFMLASCEKSGVIKNSMPSTAPGNVRARAHMMIIKMTGRRAVTYIIYNGDIIDMVCLWQQLLYNVNSVWNKHLYNIHQNVYIIIS